MGHAAEREKKIINLERLIAREKEREKKKRERLIAARKGERARERWAFRSKWVFVQSRDTERGGNKYGGGAKKRV